VFSNQKMFSQVTFVHRRGVSLREILVEFGKELEEVA
jgi:hypothetical protein